MCTAVQIVSKQGQTFWGRTQEFDIELDYVGLIIPKGIKNITALSQYTVQHSLMGVGIGDLNLVADGVNEHGLCGGTQYFANYNRYISKEAIEQQGKLPLMGEEFLTWALANCKSVSDVREKALKEVAIASGQGAFGPSLPQHFVFQDGKESIVVEPSIEGSFEIYDNPVGTFTNSPAFPWHLINLENYVGLQQSIHPNKHFDQHEIFSSGKGNGLFGMPGDFTPQSRFVRAAILKEFSAPVDNEEAIDLIFHILDSFDIPKGVVVTGENRVQYTQYTSAYDLEARKLYIHMYSNRQVQVLSLDALNDAKDVQRYQIELTQQTAPMQLI